MRASAWALLSCLSCLRDACSVPRWIVSVQDAERGRSDVGAAVRGRYGSGRYWQRRAFRWLLDICGNEVSTLSYLEDFEGGGVLTSVGRLEAG